jgi:exopolysaccharide biosynthesis polyprenyl glycosylphosphotransferase
MLQRSATRYVVLLYLCDIVLTLAALLASTKLRPLLPFGKVVSDAGTTISLEIILAAALAWTVGMAIASAYDPQHMVKARDGARATIIGVSVSALILAGFLYMSYRGLSRLLFVTFYGLDLLLLLSVRMILRHVFKRSGSPIASNRVLIVGTNRIAADIAQYLADLRWMGLEVAGFVSGGQPADGVAPAAGDAPPGPVVGEFADVPALVRSFGAAELIIAVPLDLLDGLPNVLAQLEDQPVSVKVVPDFLDLALFRSSTESLGGLPLIGIREPALSPSARLLKRMLDVLLSAILLVVLSPVFLVLALLIRLDSSGPAIFRSERVGEGGRSFWMLKFRTMVPKAADAQAAVVGRDPAGEVVIDKRPDDPRVTRLGRLLRRHSLDELPQFANVLKGEMSLVGPRAELPEVVACYEPWQRRRLSVPPGVTGWWQVTDRDQKLISLRVEQDLYYIRNYSLLLDLRILWKTIGAILSGKGAY